IVLAELFLRGMHLNCTFYLGQIFLTGASAADFASTKVSRHGYGQNDSDDCDDNHNFDKSKTTGFDGGAHYLFSNVPELRSLIFITVQVSPVNTLMLSFPYRFSS